MSQSRIFCMLARLCCGVLILAGAGCQTYPPYGYGGYSGNYNYPMYGQPGQVVAPYGGPGVIQGGPNVPMGPAGGYPNGGYPSGYQGSFPSTGTAPPFGSSSATTPPVPQVPRQDADSLGQPGTFPQTQQSLPPEYADPSDPGAGPSANRRPAPTPTGVGDGADFQQEMNGARQSTEKLKSGENESITNPKTGMLGNEFDGVQFTPPVSTKAGRSDIVQTAQHVESLQQSKLQAYGRARDGHRWFRGKIDFDKQENTWYMIYNPTPELSDQLGGMITLHDHPYLQYFTPDDVAQIDGSFDPSETDASGNPKYRIAVIRRLVEPVR